MNESHINEEWEKRFDEEFPFGEGDLTLIFKGDYENGMTKLKDFIRTLLSQALEEEREEALLKIKDLMDDEVIPHNGGRAFDQKEEMAYRVGLKDALVKLRKG